MKHTLWQNYDIDIESDDWKEYFEEMEIEPSHEAACDKVADDLDLLKDDLNIQLNNPIIEYGTAERWDGTFSGYNVIESGNIRDIISFHKDCDYAEWYYDENNIRCQQSHHDGTNSYTYRQIIDGMDADEFEEKVYTESGRVNKYALLKYTKSILPDVFKAWGKDIDPDIEKRVQVEALTDVGDWKGGKESVDKFNNPEITGFVNDFGTVTFGNNLYEIFCLDHTDGEVTFHIEQYVPLSVYHTNDIDNTKNFTFKISPFQKDVSDFVKAKDFVRFEAPDEILKDFYEFKKAIVNEMVEHEMIGFDRIDGYQELKLDSKGYIQKLNEAIADYPRTLAHKDKLTTEEYDYLTEHYVEAVLKYEAEYMENVKKWKAKDPGWDNIHRVNPQEGNEKAIKNMISNDFKDSRILILADKMNYQLGKLGKPCINTDVLKQQLANPSIKAFRQRLMEEKKQGKKAR